MTPAEPEDIDANFDDSKRYDPRRISSFRSLPKKTFFWVIEDPTGLSPNQIVERFIDINSGSLDRFVACFKTPEADADDLRSHISRKLLEQVRNDLELPKSLTAWLSRVATNRVRDKIKAAIRFEAMCVRYASRESYLSKATPELFGKVEVVRSAVDGLPEPHRTIVVSYHFHGEKLGTVADRLGMSRSKASGLRVAALKILEETLSILL